MAIIGDDEKFDDLGNLDGKEDSDPLANGQQQLP